MKYCRLFLGAWQKALSNLTYGIAKIFANAHFVAVLLLFFLRLLSFFSFPGHHRTATYNDNCKAYGNQNTRFARLSMSISGTCTAE